MHRLTLLTLLAACAAPTASDDDTGDTGAVNPAVGLAAELGLDKYVGAIDVAESVDEGGVVTETYDGASGPLCMRGDPFRASARDGSSDDLLVFLQGGGACWSEFCLAVTKAPAGIPDVDVLDPANPANPFRDHDVVYAPYCDGSLFSGDADVDDGDDGEPDRFHRGLANLTATLELAKKRHPSPPTVVLAGSSGGAYGTILGAVLVRDLFPDAEVVVLADSGTGVARGPADAAYLKGLLTEQGAIGFVPEDCPDCLDDGHVTGVVDWWLGKDPNVRVGVFSSWYDSIIGDVFLQIEPTAFRTELAAATGALHDAWPDRYRRFVVDGRMHTTLLGDPTGIVGSDLGAVELPPNGLDLLTDLELGSLDTTAIGDATVSAWIRGLLDGDTDVWVDRLAEAGEAPE